MVVEGAGVRGSGLVVIFHEYVDSLNHEKDCFSVAV